jgi:DNA modification methylase
MQIEIWPIDRFVLYARNPRKNDAAVDRMCASIKEFGFKIPVVARSSGEVVDGHLRLKAARKLGLSDIPVLLCDEWSDAQVKAFRLMVNRSVSWAEWDNELLAQELFDLRGLDFDLSLTGFDSAEIAALEPKAEDRDDEDQAPAPPDVPVTRPGDLWLLAPASGGTGASGKSGHRVMCGDSTSTDATEQLMGGRKADMAFTDLPYNCDYHGYTEERLTIQNDRMSGDEFKQFLEAAFRAMRTAVTPAASLYICHSSSWQREFENALEAAGFEVRCQIIWAKNTFAWGFGRYKFQHEPIFYAHVTGQSDTWYGDKTQSTVWQQNKPAANRLHPTMKPVELIERALVNSSRVGDAVLDLFLGSASTIIACEKTGRCGLGMELDPRYVDVCVRRWQEYSGRDATLAGDGRTFAEIAAERVPEAVAA